MAGSVCARPTRWVWLAGHFLSDWRFAMNDRTHGRVVVAQISLSLDGRVSGPGGPSDMGPIASHAVSDAAHERSARVLASATTALMGRVNYEGFHGYWPPVAHDET